MEGLTRLVSETMARHGLDVPIDHGRLQWSRWFPLESSFDLVLVPERAGIFAIAEEVIPAGELGCKRMLSVLQVSEAADLGFAMSRLFSPASPLKERVAAGRLYARYTVIEDDSHRGTALNAFQRWLASSAEAVSGIAQDSIPPAESGQAYETQEVSEPSKPVFPAGF